MSNNPSYFVGVDVGTGSVRAALVDENGVILKTSTKGIETWKPQANYFEQSSDNIWKSCLEVVKEVTHERAPNSIKGIGFDATCSLVVLDKSGEPLSVSKSENHEQNIIMWMDHRANNEADLINSTKHPMLKYVGGKVSLEMEIPKILWMKKNLKIWPKIGHLFDLPDFLTWKATGSPSRSLCSLVCKWNYERSVEGQTGWNLNFLHEVGLEELSSNNFDKIGNYALAPGMPVGKGLTAEVAQELGLLPGTAIATSIIDAHAGGLGMIGTKAANIPSKISSRLSLICGTSTCHMAVNEDAIMVPGVWGPYYSAMVPDMWLNEAGQSASGMLLDYVISSHPSGNKLMNLKLSTSEIRSHLRKILTKLAYEGSLQNVNLLTKDFHVWPDYHGNRSPLADPKMKGMLVGLTIDNSEENLALLYLATLQALAYGTRHIIDSLVSAGYQPFQSLLICGGLSQDPLFVQIQADAVGLPLLKPHEKESVLLGSAILGACASKYFSSIDEAISAMGGTADVIKPDFDIKTFHDMKYKVFLKMYRDQLDYRRIMTLSQQIK